MAALYDAVKVHSKFGEVAVPIKGIKVVASSLSKSVVEPVRLRWLLYLSLRDTNKGRSLEEKILYICDVCVYIFRWLYNLL